LAAMVSSRRIPFGREVYGPLAFRPFDGFDCSLACGTTSTCSNQYAPRPDFGESKHRWRRFASSHDDASRTELI
jgi:hypothetical protein